MKFGLFFKSFLFLLLAASNGATQAQTCQSLFSSVTNPIHPQIVARLTLARARMDAGRTTGRMENTRLESALADLHGRMIRALEDLEAAVELGDAAEQVNYENQLQQIEDEFLRVYLMNRRNASNRVTLIIRARNAQFGASVTSYLSDLYQKLATSGGWRVLRQEIENPNHPSFNGPLRVAFVIEGDAVDVFLMTEVGAHRSYSASQAGPSIRTNRLTGRPITEIAYVEVLGVDPALAKIYQQLRVTQAPYRRTYELLAGRSITDAFSGTVPEHRFRSDLVTHMMPAVRALILQELATEMTTVR